MMNIRTISLCIGILFVGISNAGRGVVTNEVANIFKDFCTGGVQLGQAFAALSENARRALEHHKSPNLVVGDVPYKYMKIENKDGVQMTHKVYIGIRSPPGLCAAANPQMATPVNNFGQSPNQFQPEDHSGGNPMDEPTATPSDGRTQPASKVFKAVVKLSQRTGKLIGDAVPVDKVAKTIKNAVYTAGEFDIEEAINQIWISLVDYKEYKEKKKFQSKLWTCIRQAFHEHIHKDRHRLRVVFFAGDSTHTEASISHDAFIHTIRHNYGNMWGIDFRNYITIDEILVADYSFDSACEKIFDISEKQFNEAVEKKRPRLAELGSYGYLLFMQKHRYELQTAIALNLANAIVVFEPYTGVGSWYKESLSNAIFSNQILKEPFMYIKEGLITTDNDIITSDIFLTKGYTHAVDRVWFAPDIAYATWENKELTSADVKNLYFYFDTKPEAPSTQPATGASEPDIMQSEKKVHHPTVHKLVPEENLTIRNSNDPITSNPPRLQTPSPMDDSMMLLFKYMEYTYWRQRLETRGIPGLKPEHPLKATGWYPEMPHPRDIRPDFREHDTSVFNVPIEIRPKKNWVGAFANKDNIVHQLLPLYHSPLTYSSAEEQQRYWGPQEP
jgi:hypothetical protein